jgi:hypothetical protein
MSRATQGLQILLIIFVMLTVVLGVTTYLYNKQAFEKTNAVVAADGRAAKAAEEKRAVEEKFDRLRKIVGHPDLDIEALEKKFEEDQQTAGATPRPAAEGDQKQAAVLGYSQLLIALCKTLDDRTTELKTAKNQVTVLETDFRTREKAKDDAVAKLDKGFADEKIRIGGIETQYKTDQTASAAELKRAKDAMQAAMTGSQAKIGVAETRADNATRIVKDKEKEIQNLLKPIRDKDPVTADQVSGEITWVSLPTKTVWINRGRADALQRQIRFTILSAESNTTATATKKGTVEVTRIVADHQAECRIVDDKLTDPIMVGDKVFTPFWSPGQQNHFALAGIMNLDGDHRNQVNAVVALIRDFGGVVDCWLDDQGHRQGQITTATQYLVQGDPPDKGSAEMVKNNGEILRDADRYQLHKWSLADFKQKMNYQKSSSVERFGTGATTSDVGRAASAAKATKAGKAAAASKTEDNADAFGK